MFIEPEFYSYHLFSLLSKLNTKTLAKCLMPCKFSAQQSVSLELAEYTNTGVWNVNTDILQTVHFQLYGNRIQIVYNIIFTVYIIHYIFYDFYRRTLADSTILYTTLHTTSYRFWIVRQSFLPSAKRSTKFKDTCLQKRTLGPLGDGLYQASLPPHFICILLVMPG